MHDVYNAVREGCIASEYSVNLCAALLLVMSMFREESVTGWQELTGVNRALIERVRKSIPSPVLPYYLALMDEEGFYGEVQLAVDALVATGRLFADRHGRYYRKAWDAHLANAEPGTGFIRVRNFHEAVVKPLLASSSKLLPAQCLERPVVPEPIVASETSEIKPGPKAEYLKIDMDWEDAVRKALACKTKPPKPKNKRRHRRAQPATVKHRTPTSPELRKLANWMKQVKP